MKNFSMYVFIGLLTLSSCSSWKMSCCKDKCEKDSCKKDEKCKEKCGSEKSTQEIKPSEESCHKKKQKP